MMAVVVGYIPTPEGRAALDHAFEVARASRRLLVVVNSSIGDTPANPRAVSEDDLVELGQQIGAAGVEHVVRQPVQGRSAADDLLAAAEEFEADLIVIGLHHRSPEGKVPLGSNAQRILLEADCLVTTVKSVDPP